MGDHSRETGLSSKYLYQVGQGGRIPALFFAYIAD